MDLRRTAKRALPPATVQRLAVLRRHARDALGPTSFTEELAEAIVRRNYPTLLRSPLPGLIDARLRCYSQNGEDGILLEILDRIGAVHGRFAELGCGDGHECCTAVLSLALGWSGLLVDRDPANIAYAAGRYAARLRRHADRVTVAQAWIDAETVDDLLRHHGYGDHLDVLVIDIDGVDYWVWKAIDSVAPRVVVIEFQPALGDQLSMTIGYRADFDRFAHHPSGAHYGASLTALVSLAREKGYALVAADPAATNAFFVAREMLSPRVPEVSVDDLFGRVFDWPRTPTWMGGDNAHASALRAGYIDVP